MSDARLTALEMLSSASVEAAVCSQTGHKSCSRAASGGPALPKLMLRTDLLPVSHGWLGCPSTHRPPTGHSHTNLLLREGKAWGGRLFMSCHIPSHLPCFQVIRFRDAFDISSGLVAARGKTATINEQRPFLCALWSPCALHQPCKRSVVMV